MNTVRIIILGTIMGTILSLLSLGSAYAAAILLTGTLALPAVIAISTIANGAILGTASIGLSYLTSGIERSVLILLISLAVAALTVMIGGYGNGSLLPLAIYILAILNSLTISRVTGALTRRAHFTDEDFVNG